MSGGDGVPVRRIENEAEWISPAQTVAAEGTGSAREGYKFIRSSGAAGGVVFGPKRRLIPQKSFQIGAQRLRSRGAERADQRRATCLTMVSSRSKRQKPTA